MPDYARYQAAFTAAARSAGLAVETLGKAFEHDVLLATNGLRDRPGVLVFSGFHGEEPAGPLGVLACLKQPGTAGLVARLNLGIVPVTNPDGFNRGVRYNRLDQANNWAMDFEPHEHPAVEGQLLLDRMDRLLPFATTCFLDMHEDEDATGFYVYANPQDSDGPTLWHLGLRRIGDRTYDLKPGHPARRLRKAVLQPDGPLEETDTPVTDGIVLGDMDGSFDEWFWHRGTPYVAVVETPAGGSLEARVACQAELLRYTLEFMGNVSNRVASRFLTGRRRRPGARP